MIGDINALWRVLIRNLSISMQLIIRYKTVPLLRLTVLDYYLFGMKEYMLSFSRVLNGQSLAGVPTLFDRKFSLDWEFMNLCSGFHHVIFHFFDMQLCTYFVDGTVKRRSSNYFCLCNQGVFVFHVPALIILTYIDLVLYTITVTFECLLH